MNVGESVRKCIDDWGTHELESAMLHACNAIDGTAGKCHPKLGNKDRFTRLLRDNYWILGPMGLPGIDLEATRFPVKVARPTASGGKPDIADVIYAVHRCTHGHGDELPDGFALIEDAAGPRRRTRMLVEHGSVRLSDRTIWGMLSVAILSPANADQRVPSGYHLSYGTSERLEINDWWGRGPDFRSVLASEQLPSLKLDFGNWTT